MKYVIEDSSKTQLDVGIIIQSKVSKRIYVIVRTNSEHGSYGLLQLDCSEIVKYDDDIEELIANALSGSYTIMIQSEPVVFVKEV